MKLKRFIIMLFLLAIIPLIGITPGPSAAQDRTVKTIEDLYPGLASDVLKTAIPAKLTKGILLTSGGLTIKESDVTEVINASQASVRKQMSQNAFFLLENMATKGLILQEAKKSGKVKGEDNQSISDFLSKTIEVPAVSEEEIKSFYGQNKETIGNAPLEQVRVMVKEYLTQQKRQEAIHQFIRTLGQRNRIQINEDWLKNQAPLALNNPVDRARRSGQPTLVEFGATGCVPCDMMTPILADLRKKFPGKLNVLFVHVGQEQILGARFGIQGIPVQVLFDKNGQEVFRHTGFFPQNELEKKMKELGVT
ncbi:MAG: thioredoxin family protein [Thermodesulfobacteriota bacterium]